MLISQIYNCSITILQTNITNADSVQISDSNTSSINWWMIIALIEFLALIYLVYRVYKKRNQSQYFTNNHKEGSELEPDENLDKMKNSSIDMTELINNIHKSGSLYKTLSRNCHPDRFTDPVRKQKADKIFQEISMNKRNHSKLLELKTIAEKELKISL